MNTMSQKHLHELLKEDQEPFLLQNYIADKRCQLKNASQKSTLHVRKRRPINQVSKFPGNICKNACFFSIQDSPDLRKSPLFEFSSPGVKSPCKSPNAIFVQIPNRTAALLVEAAMRIQKNSTSSSKLKNQNKNLRFGLVGSFLKRLTTRNRAPQREIEGDRVKDIMRWDSSVGRRKNPHEKTQLKTEEKVESCLGSVEKSASEISTACEMCFSSSSGSVDLDSASSSGQSEDSADTDCACNCEKIDNSFYESPFRFVLQTSPSSSCHRTPEFTSPAASPSRYKQEEEGSKKFQVEEEEEEKEQCSPVSVLDPPFQDEDDDDDEGRDDDDEDEDGYDTESRYAIVQRAKQNLLQKLRRFEKLAGLDPIELEKRMLEEDGGDGEYSNMDDLEGESEECIDDDSGTSDVDGSFIREVLSKLDYPCTKRISEHLKRLVSDLIFDEQREEDAAFDNREEVVRRVCKRFESWKVVQSNTIDMMVEQDFRKELQGWKKNQDQMGEAAMEIELYIFGLLVEEIVMELV